MNLQPAKTEFTEAEHGEIRRAVAEALATEAGLTQAEISRQSEVAQSVLSSYLKGSYTGDNDGPAQKLTKWLAGRRRAAELKARLPAAPIFQPLHTSQRFMALFVMALETGRMVQITGSPGVSKTASARQFCAGENRAWLATMDPSSAGVPTMLLEVLEAMGVEEAKGTPQILSKMVLKRASEAKSLIIIDEAQHLSDKALEQLRAINDMARAKSRSVGIVLLGNEKVAGKIGGTGNRAEFAQVSSRIAQRRHVVKPDPRDVAALAQAWADANREHLDKAALDFCQVIAARPGGLRNIEMTFENALLMTLEVGEPLTVEHLKGAFHQLSSLNL